MTSTDTNQKVIDILHEYSGARRDEIVPEASLTADLGLNSLDVINIIVAFEDEFGMDISEDDIRSFSNVSDIEHYIDANLQPD